MSFFQLDDPALESIRDQLMEVDIDHLTPVQALMKLHEIKRPSGKKPERRRRGGQSAAVNKSRGFQGMPRSTANSSCVSVPLNMYTPWPSSCVP